MNKLLLYILILLSLAPISWASFGARVDAFDYRHFNASNFYTTTAPIQTGTARRSSAILSSGIYELPAGLTESSIYNVGRSLPIFTKDNKRFVFVRGINDFFTNRNYIWASDNLSIDGQPGLIPLSSKLNDWIAEDGIDVVVDGNGFFSKIVRKHDDKIFVPLADAGAQLPIGPMWTTSLGITDPSDADKAKYFEFEVKVDSLPLNYDASITDSVSLNLGFYDREAAGSLYSRIEVEVNPGASNEYAYGNYESLQGEKVFQGRFPLSYFYNAVGALINPVKIRVSQPGNTNKLNFDFCELKFPLGRKTTTSSIPEIKLVDEPTWGNLISQEKLMILVKAGFSGEIKVKNATWALDVTEMGQEAELAIQAGVVNLTSSTEDRVLYFSVAPQKMTFDGEKTLEKLDLSRNDYVAIAQENANYFKTSGLGQGLYSTWENSGMNAELTEQGFTPTVVKLEDIVDVYGGGLVSSQAIVNFLNAIEQENIDHVCLVGSSSVDPKGLEGDRYPGFLGIPAGLHYGSQVGYIYTDDCYAKNESDEVTRAVGRLLVYNTTELSAWIAKRLNFEPGDFINLVSGEEQGSSSFAKDQSDKLGILPASLLSCGDVLPQIKPSFLDYVWRSSIKDNGTNLSFYQGHGAMGYLSSVNDKVLQVDHGTAIDSLSCFVLATCDAGRYFMHNQSADYSEGQLTIGARINLSYILQNGKKYVAGQNSIGIAPTSNGAVNLIASTGLAEEHWENRFTKVMLESLRDNPDLTWGELLNLKYELDQGDNSTSFHLFGDPGMSVFNKNPRRLNFSNRYYNPGDLPLSFSGGWDAKPIELKYKNYSLSSDNVIGSGSLGSVYRDTAMISLDLKSGSAQEVYGQLDFDVGNYKLPVILGLSNRFQINRGSAAFVDSDGDGLDDNWEMATFGSLTFSNGVQDSNGSGSSDKEDFLNGEDAYAFSLKLEAGWNLISLPCQLDAASELLLNSYVTTAFFYDSEKAYYHDLDLTQPFPEVTGFWAFSMEERPAIEFKGAQPLNSRLEFKNGWNLFGARLNQEAPQDDKLGVVFGWDQGTADYYQFLNSRESIIPLRGYWVEKKVVHE